MFDPRDGSWFAQCSRSKIRPEDARTKTGEGIALNWLPAIHFRPLIIATSRCRMNCSVHGVRIYRPMGEKATFGTPFDCPHLGDYKDG